MQRIETPRSSNIKLVEYNTEDKSLYVEFKAGGRYKYNNVPFEVFNEFETASSAGKYFLSTIKNKYICTRIY